MNKDIEHLRVHFTPDVMHIRESADGGTESRVVEGRAIVFNVETVMYEDKFEKVREVIEPSCVTSEWLNTQDVKLNLMHDRNMTVARCNHGSGSMKLEVREDGVYFLAEMPKCDIGDRALALIANGTFSGCSCEFRMKDYQIERRGAVNGQEQYLIRHRSFERLRALTIAMDPVYKDTSVARREWEDLNKSEKDLLEREEEERESKHLLAMREAKAKAELARRERDMQIVSALF